MYTVCFAVCSRVYSSADEEVKLGCKYYWLSLRRIVCKIGLSWKVNHRNKPIKLIIRLC